LYCVFPDPPLMVLLICLPLPLLVLIGPAPKCLAVALSDPGMSLAAIRVK
jgi:hypothetical protein